VHEQDVRDCLAPPTLMVSSMTHVPVGWNVIRPTAAAGVGAGVAGGTIVPDAEKPQTPRMGSPFIGSGSWARLTGVQSTAARENAAPVVIRDRLRFDMSSS